jgi:hypothetical protein
MSYTRTSSQSPLRSHSRKRERSSPFSCFSFPSETRLAGLLIGFYGGKEREMTCEKGFESGR